MGRIGNRPFVTQGLAADVLPERALMGLGATAAPGLPPASVAQAIRLEQA